MSKGRYIVAGRQPWNHGHFNEVLRFGAGEWVFAGSTYELNGLLTPESEWDYVFFLHWSEKVEESIISRRECVCFHMTDVPYGRGGSPLQNLIMRGHRQTILTALRMTSEFDAGPVYATRPLSLEGSTAEEIYMRASKLSCEMALEIAEERPVPVEQKGEVVTFRRRKPEESALPVDAVSLQQIHDHIRMLDAEGYPAAFVDLGRFRLEIRRSSHYHNRVEAEVCIVEKEQ